MLQETPKAKNSFVVQKHLPQPHLFLHIAFQKEAANQYKSRLMIKLEKGPICVSTNLKRAPVAKSTHQPQSETILNGDPRTTAFLKERLRREIVFHRKRLAYNI
jgi:hypothetical protein